jgi:amino acid permease
MSEQGDDSSDRPARGASPLVTAFNIFNCAVGAGILSLPYAFSQTGAILGVFVACAVVGLVVFTLNVLLRFGDAHDAWSYQALVQKALGRRFSLLVSLTLILYIFGSCVAYTIIIADSVGVVAQFARNAARASSSAASPDAAAAAAAEANAAATVRACAIVLSSALVLTPLSMLRKTRSLGPTSSLTVAALLYTTAAVVGEGVAKLRERVLVVLGRSQARHRAVLLRGNARPVAVRRGDGVGASRLCLCVSVPHTDPLLLRRVQGRTQGRGRRGGQVAC